MVGFSPDNLESIVAACRENVASIAESLSLCFDRTYRIEVGDPTTWDPESIPDGLEGPGLVARFDIDTQSMLCLIPETLPLPEWYREPGDSERSRLETLAMEWSLNMLPGDLEAEGYAATAVSSLKEEVQQADSTEAVNALEMLVFDAGEGEAEETGDTESGQSTAEPKARLLLVWPVAMLSPPTDDESSTESNSGDSAAPMSDENAYSPASDASRRRMARLLNLPVTVIVQLADKKIELGQLLSLTPGALVTFNKSCEEMLDLYVSNHLYAQGEAVKIGEKFGIKISKIGVSEQRASKIV